MNEPDDRELDRYLKGDSALSKRYREASDERAPAALDDAILAAAKREVRAKPGLSKVLAPVALAASLILGVNLAWNLHEAQPLPEAESKAALPAPATGSLAPRQPAERLQAESARARQKANAARAERDASRELADARGQEAAAAARAPAMSAESAARDDAPKAYAAAPAAAPPPALTEDQKIGELMSYVAGLQGAVFIRNGDEHTPAEAAAHMKLKREKAGKRVKTAEDFIKYCASHSTMSGEAYLIRYADGRTRTAEDVLREQLARINGSAQ